MEIFGLIGTWFGYVGACVVSPDATCRPLLAFFALGAAAAVALTLTLLAYQRAQRREAAEIEETRTLAHAQEVQDRLRRTLAAKITPPKPALRGRMPAAA